MRRERTGSAQSGASCEGSVRECRVGGANGWHSEPAHSQFAAWGDDNYPYLAATFSQYFVPLQL